MQEPKVVTPVAVLPPEVMLKVGEAAVLVRAKVVAVPVVPKAGTPAGKLKGVLTTAAAFNAVTGVETLAVLVTEEKPGELLPPPPQAARVTAKIAANPNFESFIIIAIFLTRLLQNDQSIRNFSWCKQILRFLLLRQLKSNLKKEKWD